jgi:SNF2 family DNA or RNA helicase
MTELVAEARAEGAVLRIAPIRSADISGTVRMLRERHGFGAVRRVGGAVVVSARDARWLLDPVAADAAGIRLTGSARRALEIRSRIARTHDTERDRLDMLRRGGVDAARELLASEGGRRQLDALDDHQVVNVAAMTSPTGYGICLFDEQGAGKTVSVIYAFDRLVDRNLIDTAVIVAPKSMVGEWVQAFQDFMGDLYKVRVVTGSATERRAAVRSGCDVLVLNYEAVRTVQDELVLALRRAPDRAALVVDESFNVKNPEARRTRDLVGMRDWFARTWVLCGTPAPNTAHDVVAQVDLVDLGQTFGSVNVPEDRSAALPVVQAALDQRTLYLRNLKSDVLPELPGKTFTTLRLPFARTQRCMYDEVLGRLAEDVAGTDEQAFRHDLTSFLARRMSLLRIASNPIGIDPSYDETPAKLLALDGLLQSLVEDRGEKVVVWSCFTASLEAITTRYARYGVVRYDGTVTSIADRREAVRSFQQDTAVRLFVGNAAAAGAGLTLHAARVAIYESISNQAAHYLQSLDRIHRRGQTREVEYYVLLCDGSLEEIEFRRLMAKESAARELLRDDVDVPVTRDAFLADLEEARRLLSTS